MMDSKPVARTDLEFRLSSPAADSHIVTAVGTHGVNVAV